MSLSIFVRGETGIRPLIPELHLLYHMLSPDAQVHDLAYYMIQYLEGLQRGQRNPGALWGGAYVSRIASHLGVPLGVDGPRGGM